MKGPADVKMHQATPVDDPTVHSLDESHLDMGALNTDFIEGILEEDVLAMQPDDMKENLNVAEVIAELEKERRKNVELLGRVSSLEAKLGCEDSNTGPLLERTDVEDDAHQALKRLRVGSIKSTEEEDKQDASAMSSPNHISSQISDAISPRLEIFNGTGRPVLTSYESMVNWMCREDVSSADIEKLNDAGSEDDEDDEDDDDEDDDDDDDNNELGDNGRRQAREKVKPDEQDIGLSTRVLDSDDSGGEETGLKDQKKGEGQKTLQGKRIYWSKRYGYGPYPVRYREAGIYSSYKKAPKIAFSPMEVKRILDSGVLLLKNAQSHTMRKIIVFSCLCIRHGCEDFYELDFNHFQVFNRGEPYKSTKDPGEHLLYSHPSGRTKIFFPNRQNPVLCPIRIIDEEKEMRPTYAVTPSYLFLCMKYGGRTRNLPQNQYVRQRMGRNKLKSFGPLMCQMALLVHVRTGSFFFKALGITLLFMAGFSDDQVRKETKYRNLDLLRKYYRSDESAKVEQLFHPFPTFFSPASQLSSSPQGTTAQSQAPTSTTLPQAAPLVKKPPPLLVRKDPAPVPVSVTARPKPSTDRPYRRIPPLPFHLMKAPKRGRKPKNAEKSNPTLLAPSPYGAFRHYPPMGFPPMPPPPGWRPGNGFPPPSSFPFPFPMFPPNPQLGSSSPPPFFPPPFAFPPFMVPPPLSSPPQPSQQTPAQPESIQQEPHQPDVQSLSFVTECDRKSGGT